MAALAQYPPGSQLHFLIISFSCLGSRSPAPFSCVFFRVENTEAPDQGLPFDSSTALFLPFGDRPTISRDPLFSITGTKFGILTGTIL